MLLDEKITQHLAYDELQATAARLGIVMELIDEKEMRWLELNERT